jgi:hypothetical protein
MHYRALFRNDLEYNSLLVNHYRFIDNLINQLSLTIIGICRINVVETYTGIADL